MASDASANGSQVTVKAHLASPAHNEIKVKMNPENVRDCFLLLDNLLRRSKEERDEEVACIELKNGVRQLNIENLAGQLFG